MSKWEQVPLADLCTFQRGLTYSKSDEVDYSANGVLRANNIDLWTNQLNLREIRYISDSIKVPANKKVRPGTLLICTASGSRSHLGKVALVEEVHDLAFGGFMGLITPNALIESRYLYYALIGERFQEKLDTLAGGTNINNLKFKDIYDFPVPLPTVEDQRKVVAILDDAFGAIATATANAKKNLANARELFERILQDVFVKRGSDWIEEPLNANVRFVDYRGKTPPKRESGVRLITAKNVKMGHIQRAPEEFIDVAAYDGWMTRGFPSKGDVLFTTEAPLGNVAQLDTNEKVVIGQRLITMQPKVGSVDGTFLKYMLCSAPLQELIMNQATGATVSGIKARLLKLIPISYPRSVEEQGEIVRRLDAAYALSNSLADQYRKKIDGLALLKQSLLHSAFGGNLSLQHSEAITA